MIRLSDTEGTQAAAGQVDGAVLTVVDYCTTALYSRGSATLMLLWENVYIGANTSVDIIVRLA